MEDLNHAAQIDRREAQPNTESNYLFNTVPQATADPNIYFFDKRQQPKVPGEYSPKTIKTKSVCGPNPNAIHRMNTTVCKADKKPMHPNKTVTTNKFIKNSPLVGGF